MGSSSFVVPFRGGALRTVAVLALLAASPLAQRHYKLSGPITTPPRAEGQMHDAAISPDGTRVVYVAEQGTLGVKELYSVPLDGSAPSVRLSGPTHGDGGFLSFSISPDSRRVVYTADPEGNFLYGLYSVPIMGGAPVQLVPQTGNPFSPSNYRISADASRVVLWVGDGLFSAPIDGSAPAVRLNGRVGSGSYFEISPDNRRVAFTGFDGSGVEALYSVPIAAGPSAPGHTRRIPRLRLTPSPVPGGHIWSIRISSDGRHVVYKVRDESFEIYSVPIDGSRPPVRLNGALAPGGDVQLFDLSPDGSRVVYVADQEQDWRFELYSVPTDASASAVKLNGPLVAGGRVLPFNTGFEISSDGSRVVYRAIQDTIGVEELYSVPIDASATPVKISAPLVAGESLESFELSPDGSRVVYLTTQDCHETLILRSVPSDGSSPALPINDAHVGQCSEYGEWDHFEYRISPDSRRVVYVTEEGGYFLELYSTPIEGGASDVELSLTPSGNLADDGIPFALSPDGSQVVFGAWPEATFLPLQLYRALIDGSASPVQLNPPLALGPIPGEVHTFEVSPDSAWVVYAADQETAGAQELYGVPSDASAGAVKLNGPLHAGGAERQFEIAPDSIAPVSARVLYLADEHGALELHAASIDGRFPAVRLNGPLVAGGRVDAFQLSPDGGRAVYRANQDQLAVDELYSVPTDGSAAPRKLNGPLVAGGDVGFWFCDPEGEPHSSFTPDGSRFVYFADQEQDEVQELYSVPSDGSAPALKLNGSLTFGGDVTCFRISPDGLCVVYTADQEQNDVVELYSVPVDASASPLKLNGPLVPGGGVEFAPFGIRISPDGSRVLYVADQERNDVDELFSVPIDGSAPAVKLNGPMVPGGDVRRLDLEISASGARVVYIADQERNERHELYSAPLDGSQPAVRLNPTLANDRDVHSFAISPTLARVVYVADQETDQVFELYSVPLDGSSAPVSLGLVSTSAVRFFQIGPDGRQVFYRRNGRLYRTSILGNSATIELDRVLRPESGVGFFQCAPDGDHVFYLADQDTDSVFELYATVLGPRARFR